MVACGGTPPPVAEAAREPDVRAALPDGASLIVVARPRELFESEPGALVVHCVVPDAQLESLRIQHGVDVRTLDRLAFARYESETSGGSVLVVQGPFRAEVATLELGHHMLPHEAISEGPPARAAGIFHGTRVEAIAIGAHTVALIIGPPALATRVLRTVDGTTPPAIAGSVQQALARHAADPFVAMRPVPLSLPPGGAVSLLLAEEESLTVAIAPVAPSTVHVEADLTGTFPSTAEENFRQLVVSLAQSTMGTALGLRSALGTLRVTADEHTVAVAADFDAGELARGLSLLFRAEIADVLADPADPRIGDPAESPAATTN